VKIWLIKGAKVIRGRDKTVSEPLNIDQKQY
jgi:hypothetical protein